MTTETHKEIIKELEKLSMSPEECKLHTDILAENIEQATGIRPPMGQAPDIPDYPSCDNCQTEFAGKLHCSRCQCAFYCSRDCQSAHWKAKKVPGSGHSQGHKTMCKGLKEKCQNDADTFLNIMTATDEECPVHIKMAPGKWNLLDNSGAYKMALDQNLNSTIQNLMQDEIDHAKDRFRSGFIDSYVQLLMCQLFRDGRNIPGQLFSNIDAYRIKKYVRSSDEAFQQWFKASMIIIQIFQTQGMAASRGGGSPNGMGQFWSIQRIARDVATAWGYVFTNPKASKAIILGESKTPDDTAVLRAKWIIRQLKEVILYFPDGSPDNSAIEGQVNMFTAMIEIRLEEFGVEVGNYTSLLGLKGTRLYMYDNMAIPFAFATMAKGRSLNGQETQMAIMTYAQQAKDLSKRRTSRGVAISGETVAAAATAAGSQSSDGKKKRKKKGKKNRK